MVRHFRTVTLFCTILFLLVSSADAKKKQRRADAPDPQQTKGGQFDYYVLSLSWAPNFCGSHQGNARECGTGRHVGFVVHGLWPQMGFGKERQPCQHTSPVSQAIVNQMLDLIPAAGLIQHEWSCHGVYSGLQPADYFATVRKAFEAVRIPESLRNLSQETQLSGDAINREFGEANHASLAAFGISCHDKELVSVQACLTKDLKSRACGPEVNRCDGQLLLRPPR